MRFASFRGASRSGDKSTFGIRELRGEEPPGNLKVMLLHIAQIQKS